MILKITFLIIITLTIFTVIKAQDDDQPIKINTYLLNIPVIASDRDGRNVAGLTRENFTVTQDGVKQDIAYFAEEEAPVNVAILIQTSYGSKRVLGEIKDAATDFIKILRPDDKALIVSFDTQVRKLSSFTSDQNELLKAVNKAHIDNNYKLQPDFQGKVNGLGAYLQDAMYQLVTQDFSVLKGRKAIIVLGAGEYQSAQVSDRKLLDKLAESDVVVYQLIVRDKSFSTEKIRKPSSITFPNGKVITSRKEIRQLFIDYYNEKWAFINELADVTGGRIYPESLKNFDQGYEVLDFKQVFQTIADELKKQYVIGFYPQNVGDGKQTLITVDVNPDDIFIRTKSRIKLRTSGIENK